MRVGDGRWSVGAGENIVNQRFAPFRLVETGRSEGLQDTVRTIFARDLRGTTALTVTLAPYGHVDSGVEFFQRPGGARSYRQTLHGARVDGELRRTIRLRGYAFTYGLRYINQTTNYGRIATYSKANFGVNLTRNSMLAPFVGLRVPL